MGILQRWRPIEGNDQKIAFTATPSTETNPFGPETWAIYVTVTQNCHIAIGMNPVATTSNYLLKNTDYSFLIGVSPGEKLSAVQDTTGGSLYIMELTQ
jgi:hypothetical protein